MLTKYLVTAAFIALAGLFFFRSRGRAAPPAERPRPREPDAAETVRCTACGAWHLASEPCLCGAPRRG